VHRYVPALTAVQQRNWPGELLLDQLNKSFIYAHLRYRFAVYEGAEALPVERAVRAGGLLAGRPYLNPL